MGRRSRDALTAIWLEPDGPRKGSADERIISWPLERAVVEAHNVACAAGVEGRSVRLAAEITTLITQSKRGRASAATEVLEEVDGSPSA